MMDLTEVFHEKMPKRGVYLKQEGNRQILLDQESGSIVVEATATQGLAQIISQQFELDHNIKEPLFFDGGHPDSEGFILFAEEVEKFSSSTKLDLSSFASRKCQIGRR